jgi:protein SCO1/2
MPWSRLFSIILAALGALWAAAASARDPSPWNQGYLPNVPVVTQDGKTVRFYDDLIKGRTVLISFIFTSCPNICPVVTARLAQVQDKLGDAMGRDVSFLSISIDPETDTPAKLEAYAKTFGAGAGWTFVTGDGPTIAMLRHKLGERSRKLVEHNNTVLLYNDATGEWSRDSAFSDLAVLAANIRAMNPAASASPATQDATVRETSITLDLPGQSLFIKTCAACHTVGNGDRVGPDLASLSRRRSREWTVRYLMAPETMRKEGDPVALDLAARFPAVRMPTLSLSAEDSGDLIAYIDAMTYAAGAGTPKGPTSQAAQADHSGHHHH